MSEMNAKSRLPELPSPAAVFLMGCALVSASANAATIRKTINGTAMPWIVSSTKNAKYPFGIGDGTPPPRIKLTKLGATGGGTVTIKYVAGTVSAETGTYAPTDANGDTGFVANNGTGNGYGVFPSYYMTPYPIYLCELVGTFAKSNGDIVGTPFAVGDGPTSVTIPAGAVFLQVGANDDKFSDNSGKWTISVSSP